MNRKTGAERLAVVTALGLLLGSLTACSESGGPGTTGAGASAKTPVVHVVNYPLMYFATRVGGDHVDVRFLAPADGDPAFWEPTEADVAALQQADLILLNGATYAKWLDHVSLPESRTVDTSAAFGDSLIKTMGGVTHSHGGDGDHSHAGTAFTTWIDMSLARRHVEAVRDALVALRPEARDDLTTNAAALVADLDALDRDLAAVAATIGDQPLMASHPVYQYLARRYDLDIDAVLWEPETVPDEDAMVDLGASLAGRSVRWMIWEGEPVSESVAKLEAVGLGSVVFDPCGNRPDEGDWMTVMRQNVENLKVIGG